MIKCHLQILTFCMFFYRIGTEMMDKPPAIKHLGLIFKKDLNLLQLMSLQTFDYLESEQEWATSQCFPFNASLTTTFSEDPSGFHRMLLDKLHSIKLWCLSLHTALLGAQ